MQYLAGLVGRYTVLSDVQQNQLVEIEYPYETCINVIILITFMHVSGKKIGLCLILYPLFLIGEVAMLLLEVMRCPGERIASTDSPLLCGVCKKEGAEVFWYSGVSHGAHAQCYWIMKPIEADVNQRIASVY